MTVNTIKKSDDELQIVWSELYLPGILDAQKNFMSVEEIAKAAYRWMAKSETRCIDVEHNLEVVNAVVVESFIARKGDPDFVEGSWVIGVHIPDDTLWGMVKKGEFNGFSLYGNAALHQPVKREVPAEVTGVTKSEDGHSHNFYVAYAPNGEFIGGYTDEVDGHSHMIRRGTVTEKAEGHDHVFDFVKGVLDVTAAGG